jgi:hypothetical protein
MGHEIGRPSLLYLRAEEDENGGTRVSVGGKVEMVACGELLSKFSAPILSPKHPWPHPSHNYRIIFVILCSPRLGRLASYPHRTRAIVCLVPR